MDHLRVWFIVKGEQHFHAVENFIHGVKVVNYMSDKFGPLNTGLEQMMDGWWMEWEDDYGLNVHEQDIEMSV